MSERSSNHVNWRLLRNTLQWPKSSFSPLAYQLRPLSALPSISSLLHNVFRSYTRPSGIDCSTEPSTEPSTDSTDPAMPPLLSESDALISS